MQHHLSLLPMLQGRSVGNLAFYLHSSSQSTQGSYANGGGSASSGSGGILSGAREATGYSSTSYSQAQSGRLHAAPCGSMQASICPGAAGPRL